MTPSNAHHRRSIRLQGYDYAQAGAYFVTICTQNQECLLGEVVDGEMALNDVGRMVQSMWDGLPRRFPFIELDQFGVMPNHVHGIVVLTGRLPAQDDHPRPTPGDHKDRPYKLSPGRGEGRGESCIRLTKDRYPPPSWAITRITPTQPLPLRMIVKIVTTKPTEH
jgi:hypothetical protein